MVFPFLVCFTFRGVHRHGLVCTLCLSAGLSTGEAAWGSSPNCLRSLPESCPALWWRWPGVSHLLVSLPAWQWVSPWAHPSAGSTCVEVSCRASAGCGEQGCVCGRCERAPLPVPLHHSRDLSAGFVTPCLEKLAFSVSLFSLSHRVGLG